MSTALVALVSCLALQAAPCEGVLLGACGRVMLQIPPRLRFLSEIKGGTMQQVLGSTCMHGDGVGGRGYCSLRRGCVVFS